MEQISIEEFLWNSGYYMALPDAPNQDENKEDDKIIEEQKKEPKLGFNEVTI